MAMNERNLTTYEDQPYIAQVVINPEKALAAYKALQDITKQVLRKGTDYDIIPGTPKPTLLKSGAENLLRFYGLGHMIEKVGSIEDWENGIFYFEYKVSIHRLTPDENRMIIAECIGSCNNREPKYYKYKNGGLRDPYEQINTLQKMAIKRALVGAALQATGASGLFTQDLDEYQINEQQQQSHQENRYDQRQERAGENQQSQGGQDTPPPSDAQVKYIFRLKGEKQISDEAFEGMMAEGYNGKTSMKELTKKEASNFIDHLNRL